MDNKTLREFTVTRFKGDFPEIPTYPDIDIAALTAKDIKAGEEPKFITLRIAREGAKSANGLLYDAPLLSSIEEQLQGVGGLMGHLDDDKRDTDFPIDAVDWVGHFRDGDTLWAKAYIPPGEVRDMVERVQARRGKLATSIYGPFESREALPDGSWRANGFKLESLDLAPASRAALKLGGDFKITAQMETDNDSEDESMDKAQLIAELKVTDIPALLREQIIQEFKDKQGEDEHVKELETKLKAAEDQVAEMRTQKADAERAAFDAKLDSLVAETVKVEALRPVARRAVVVELAGETDEEKAKAALKEYTEGEEFKNLAKAMVMELAGPGAFIPGVDKGGKGGSQTWKDQLADNAGKLAQEIGAVS